MRDDVWICDCPVCRLLVKPVLKLFITEEDGEVKMSQDNKEKELEELKELITALKDSIVELKSTLMDAVSPFSKMRTSEAERTEEEMLEPVSARGAPTTIAQLHEQPSLPKEEQKPIEAEKPKTEKKEESRRTQEAQLPSIPTLTFEETREAKRQKAPYTGIDIKKTFKLLKLLYKLNQSLPPESIENYISFMKTMGLIDEKTENALLLLKKMVDSGIQAGLDPEDQIIALYSLAKMLGVTDPELEEEIAFSLANKLRRKEAT